jgi:UDP-GlcNAc:undecaprenyl-phosphate GlcNAc-1-phosphate transferase
MIISDTLPIAQNMTNQLFSLLISLLAGIGLGYSVTLLAKHLKLMDIPGTAPHKTHARPTPLGGGLLLFLIIVLMTLFFLEQVSREMAVAFAGTLIVFIFGLWDDSKGLSAVPKLLGQLIAAAILIAFGVQVRFMDTLSINGILSPELAQVFNMLITLFWLVGITNALNMIDSMDGIAAGLGVIAFGSFWVASTISGQSNLAFWSASLLGICAGLYYWNGIAVKFFLGDSGTQPLGFLLASFSMMYNPLERAPESSWIVPIMLLGVPIFDTTLVVLSRLRRKQPVGTGRRDHTYHRFIALGLSPKLAVLTVHLMSFILSALAFLTLYLPPSLALTLFIIALLCGLVLLLWLEPKPTLDDSPGTDNYA